MGPSTVAGACSFHFISPSTTFPVRGGEYFHKATFPMLVPPAKVPVKNKRNDTCTSISFIKAQTNVLKFKHSTGLTFFGTV